MPGFCTVSWILSIQVEVRPALLPVEHYCWRTVLYLGEQDWTCQKGCQRVFYLSRFQRPVVELDAGCQASPGPPLNLNNIRNMGYGRVKYRLTIFTWFPYSSNCTYGYPVIPTLPPSIQSMVGYVVSWSSGTCDNSKHNKWQVSEHRGDRRWYTLTINSLAMKGVSVYLGWVSKSVTQFLACLIIEVCFHHESPNLHLSIMTSHFPVHRKGSISVKVWEKSSEQRR